MSVPYDYEALWLKAKLFLNRAMEENEPRSFDERALWASLALELLAKAALARVSPLLIAEPSEDGTNLLIASGLVEGDARFTSVRAKTVYSRCHKAFKPFSEAEAMKITHARRVPSWERRRVHIDPGRGMVAPVLEPCSHPHQRTGTRD